MAVDYRSIYEPVARAAAAANNIDPEVFVRLIASESSFNPYAINPQSVGGQNASGIAQFLPSTAASLGVDPFDPYSALDGAAKYLADLEKSTGNLALALAKYKGFADPTSERAMRSVAPILGDAPQLTIPAPISANEVQQNIAKEARGSKPFWQLTTADFIDAFKNVGFSLIVLVLGGIIIFFSAKKLIE